MYWEGGANCHHYISARCGWRVMPTPNLNFALQSACLGNQNDHWIAVVVIFHLISYLTVNFVRYYIYRSNTIVYSFIRIEPCIYIYTFCINPGGRVIQEVGISRRWSYPGGRDIQERWPGGCYKEESTNLELERSARGLNAVVIGSPRNVSDKDYLLPFTFIFYVLWAPHTLIMASSPLMLE